MLNTHYGLYGSVISEIDFICCRYGGVSGGFSHLSERNAQRQASAMPPSHARCRSEIDSAESRATPMPKEYIVPRL